MCMIGHADLTCLISRFALQRVGEDRSPKHWQGQDVAVLGANRIAMSISARLCRAGCRVRVVRSDDVSEAVAKMRIDQVGLHQDATYRFRPNPHTIYRSWHHLHRRRRTRMLSSTYG